MSSPAATCAVRLLTESHRAEKVFLEKVYRTLMEERCRTMKSVVHFRRGLFYGIDLQRLIETTALQTQGISATFSEVELIPSDRQNLPRERTMIAMVDYQMIRRPASAYVPFFLIVQ